MKVMICANLLIGDPGVLNMSGDLLMQWHAEKIEALAVALESGRDAGAQVCIMAGGLFAEGFISQKLLDEAVEELGSHDIPVIWLPLQREAADLATRVSVPEGVTVLRDCSRDVVEGLRVLHGGDGVEVSLRLADGSVIRKLGLLEPMGFGDQAGSGFLLADVVDGAVANVQEVPCALHPFITRYADMSGKDSSKDLLAAIQGSIEGVAQHECLRLVLRGATPLSAYFKTSELERVLANRFFYAEVANECTVALDESDLEGDVSLLAEFVRIVDADDSLSSVEKARVMRCGWNALNGKELAE